MGLSLKKMFSGKGWKKFKRAIGGVAKVALGVIPGAGGIVGGVAGKLLNAKKVKDVGGVLDKLGKGAKLLNISKRGGPVYLPGGALSTPQGPMVVPPVLRLPGAAGAPKPRRKAKPKPRRRATWLGSAPRRKKGTRTRKPRTYKRSTKGRLPKFGSPAWRKRFLNPKRKKRKAS